MENYHEAVNIAGADPYVVVRYLPLMMVGTARQWLSTLPENSINSWQDLYSQFCDNFQGTYNRPETLQDLKLCIQKKGETAREHLAQWVATKNACEKVNEQQAIDAYMDKLSQGLLRYKLVCKNPRSLNKLIEIASKHCAGDDDADMHKKPGGGTKRKENPSDAAEKVDLVALTFGGSEHKGGRGGHTASGGSRGRGRGAGKG